MKLLSLFMLSFVLVIGSGHAQVPNLSLEEKVGQLLMVHFNGEDANEDAKSLIQETKVGGFIYYTWSNGLTSPKQVKNLSAGLQNLAEENTQPIPLLIAIDQEGGPVSRLKNGFAQFPENKELGETGDPLLAEIAAQGIGEELLAVGINMNLAPVVDVCMNPKSPLQDRCFGSIPEMVVSFGECALRGYHNAHVITTLKHFPGHGSVEVDSHEGLPVVLKSMEELEKVDLYPFAKLASNTDAIMTAHILAPALDPDNCSTLSKKTLMMLREKIGFTGVIISDSLIMDGVLKKCQTVDEAAIQALSAGCDILLLGGKLFQGEHKGMELTSSDVRRIHKSLVDAVKSGRVPESRLDAAVARVFALKERYITQEPH